ncbi:MAG: DUF2865 domain-containing protein [Methylobacteriaceae bacterium]|nr:DUF2865 domain-containing protein [Methylobacteriaceae bacterium]
MGRDEPSRHGRASARKRGIRAGHGALLAALLAISAVATVLFDRVLARDGSGMWEFLRSEGAKYQESLAPADPSLASPRSIFPHRHRSTSYAEGYGLGGRAVCVRLCDGYFFPVGDVRDQASLQAQEAMCSGLCPDAPTRLYTVPPGADGIEGAVSRDGHPYSALPVALRYTHAVDDACTCRRNNQQQALLVSLMKDFTLRRGDAVMTRSGLLVFNGAGRWPYLRSDFATLAEARNRIENAAALSTVESTLAPPRDNGPGGAGLPKTSGAPQPAAFVNDPAGNAVRVVGTDAMAPK